METFEARGEYSDISMSLFRNMDETAVYFEAKSKSTAHPQEATTNHVRASGSCNSRTTVCCPIVADGTKIPLFHIFKIEGTPAGHIETSLYKTIQERA